MIKISQKTLAIVMEIGCFVASGYVFHFNRIAGIGLFFFGFMAAITAGEMIKKDARVHKGG